MSWAIAEKRLAAAKGAVGAAVLESSSSSESSSESESDDDDPAGYKRRARRQTAAAKKVLGARIAEQRMLGLGESGQLFRELNPTRRWLKDLRRSTMATDAGLSVFALFAGAWWPCCASRVRDAPRACVCGYKEDDGPGRNLVVHFLLGDDGTGVPCTAAVDARKEWRKRVRAAFGASGEISWLSQAAPSLAVVARCLGGGGRRQVSKWLARKLPKIFIETFGEWAASERCSGAVDRMFSSSPAEEADEDDDVGDAAV